MGVIALTTRHYECFKNECRKWIGFFGLSGWEVVFTFNEDDLCASCAVNLSSHIAMLSLSSCPTVDYDIEDYDEYVKQSAFHEVCELLLFEFELTALDRRIKQKPHKELVDARRHEVIHRLFAVYDSCLK